ncbi:MAG: NADH-quinone oxidoreductase [Thermoproteus sp. AZ2]|jgi:NADH-quinone oxidoreductase subunit J|uniref:NADH-quinone oxidoreductase n=1 Tax=Thermoproteus sp. AZ2 TaxID=1609232 RepID=A0ACC6V1T8_9CREN
MLDYLLLALTAIFGLVAVLVRDNAYAAVSLALASASAAAYYALLGLFLQSFLIFIVYIGAVVLMVLTTAAMYGGFFEYPTHYKILVAALVVIAAVLLWLLVPGLPPVAAAQAPPQPSYDLYAMVAALLISSLVVAIEVARKL